MKTRFFLIIVIWVNAFSQQLIEGTVVAVKDGDTIEIITSEKELHRIRLSSIDCPEYTQPFSDKAKKLTSDLSYKKRVKVIITSTDHYGRLIGEVILDNGKSLNNLLVQSGLAWHYKKYSNNKELDSLENDARNKKLGLWLDNNPTAPWEFRRIKNN